MSNANDYEKLKNHPGIYKHKKTGRYHARKKINGKVYNQTFETLNEARKWRHAFNGKEDKPQEKFTPTLLEVWKRMEALHFPSLSTSTKVVWARRFENLSFLYDYQMEDIKPSVINEWLGYLIDKYNSEDFELGRGLGARKVSFDNELNMLVTICNWYKNEEEFGHHDFVHPVLPRHRLMSKFREAPIRNKKIPPEEAVKFFYVLPELYRDLVMMQYLVAGRIGEIAGIQIKNIDLENQILTIKETCIWCNGAKTFVELKPFPKNKDIRQCHITPLMMGIIKRRLKLRAKGCNFLFHVDGKPLNYCTIQSQLRNAQRKIGSKFAGTHIFRHGMATLVRKLTNSLDAVQAMTGHQDRDLADHYSQIDSNVQKETAEIVEKHLRGLLGEEENVVPFKQIVS